MRREKDLVRSGIEEVLKEVLGDDSRRPSWKEGRLCSVPGHSKACNRGLPMPGRRGGPLVALERCLSKRSSHAPKKSFATSSCCLKPCGEVSCNATSPPCTCTLEVYTTGGVTRMPKAISSLTSASGAVAALKISLSFGPMQQTTFSYNDFFTSRALNGYEGTGSCSSTGV